MGVNNGHRYSGSEAEYSRRQRSIIRRRKKRMRKIATATVVVAIFVIVAAVVLGVVLNSGNDDDSPVGGLISDEHGQVENEDVIDIGEVDPEGSDVGEDEPGDDDPDEGSSGGVVITVPEEPEVKTQTVELHEEDIKKGILILVNRQYMYDFSENKAMVDLFTYKSSAYKFRDTGMMFDETAAEELNRMLVDFYENTNNGNVNIISTYRDIETQQRIYNSKLSYYGGDVETTEKWVALPGASEHHTGLAVDFGIYTNDGESYDFRGEKEYAWINTNCYKYGFIVRYDSAKTDITGIAYEPWHFRYLGVPHAEIISGTELCYEEYISYIKAFPYDGDHMYFTSETGAKYEIFYVKSQGAVTTIELDEDADYFVSGNNVDGFIVTITLSDAQ